MNNCSICGSPLENKAILERNSIYSFDCIRCGKYRIEEFTVGEFKETPQAEDEDWRFRRVKLSGYIANNPHVEITRDNLKRIVCSEMPSVDEKATILLQGYSKMFPKAGKLIPYIGQTTMDYFNRTRKIYNVTDADRKYLKLLCSCYLVDLEEFKYIVEDYLAGERKYLLPPNELGYKISPAGWAYLESLKQVNKDSHTAFIAMRFENSLLEYADQWFEKGILGAGYKPVRIDKHAHNNLIDDEIIANIRKSRFVVADFTQNNNGVYYEAGYARGLGIPVIYLCNGEYFEKPGLHFDANHYPVIKWDFNNGEILSQRLSNRIEATVGRGKYKPEDIFTP